MSTLKTNTIPQEDLRALHGPVAQADGRVASVSQTDAWRYSIAPLNPKTKDGREVSEPHATVDQARKALGERLGGGEKKAWAHEPHKTLEVGQPWFRQRVGDREIPAEAVFARACHIGNVDLAVASAEKITRPNAADPAGNTLLIYAAGVKESTAPMQALLDRGADPKRANTHGWTPAHAAAAIGEPARVVQLVQAGGNARAQDANGKSPLALLSPEDRKSIETKIPRTVAPPKANPMSSGKTLADIPRPAPKAAEQGKTKSRDIQRF